MAPVGRRFHRILCDFSHVLDSMPLFGTFSILFLPRTSCKPTKFHEFRAFVCCSLGYRKASRLELGVDLRQLHNAPVEPDEDGELHEGGHAAAERVHAAVVVEP